MPNQMSSPNEVVVTTTSDYTFPTSGAIPSLLLVDTTSGNITVTLPSPAGLYALYPYDSRQGDVMIMNIGATGYAVNVTTSSGTLRGQDQIGQVYQAVRYLSDGISTWNGMGSRQNSFVRYYSLTSANILAMNGAPVTILPAPGAGKVIVVEHIALKMTTTATQYANGGAVEFRYTNGSGAKVTADIAAAVITATAGDSYTLNAGVSTSLTGVVNAPIVVTNATAAFITGTGTGVIAIKYRIEDFA